MDRRYGLLTGDWQERWCTDWTRTVEMLQRWCFVKISAVEMKYSLNMDCKGGLKAGHGLWTFEMELGQLALMIGPQHKLYMG